MRTNTLVFKLNPSKQREPRVWVFFCAARGTLILREQGVRKACGGNKSPSCHPLHPPSEVEERESRPSLGCGSEGWARLIWPNVCLFQELPAALLKGTDTDSAQVTQAPSLHRPQVLWEQVASWHYNQATCRAEGSVFLSILRAGDTRLKWKLGRHLNLTINSKTTNLTAGR